MNVCISIPEGAVSHNEDFIKHVEFNGQDEHKYSIAYKKLGNTLFFKYLESKESFLLQEQLMAVSFNTSMPEEANIKLCKDILKKGIFCDGKIFHFLGHSISQLKEKTCFMMEGSDEEIQTHLRNFGEFVEVNDVNIRAKKIGVLFTPFQYFVEVNEDPREMLGSICGPGFMSQEFAAKVRALMDVNYPEPSALLVHYQGFQGISVLKTEHVSTPSLQDQSHERTGISTPSLQDQSHERTGQTTTPQEVSRPVSKLACILDYSRPGVNAYLDAKLVMLLAARGVQIKDLRALQTDYYKLLEKMCHDSASKDYFLRLTGRTIEGSQTDGDIRALRREEVRNMLEWNGSRTGVPRVRILVPKARVVFGVGDPYGKLKKGECYFKPTLVHGEGSEFEAEKKVFVVRTPCYHPGDIHVFKLCHEKTAYQNLINCLVLPLGHAFENTTADLNENQFIVCWDANLIPKQKVKPCSCLPTSREKMNRTWDKCLSYFRKSPPKTAKEQREELIDHFASFKDDLPRRIDQVYMKRARTGYGLSSTECEQLSKMYHQATNYTVDEEYFLKRLKELESSYSFGHREDGRNRRPFQRNREFQVGGSLLKDFESAAFDFVGEIGPTC